jgi:WD40 repeat protein/serine/threonine protein kinase/class 3 adenylate cyclase
MDVPGAGPERARVEEFRRRHHTGLVTLVFTDLVDSVALRRELGDQAATTLLQAHRRLVRELLGRAVDAEEIETAGDSFLLLVARPSDAVKFSLQLQHQTGDLAREHKAALGVRIGIHVGEVVIEEHAQGSKPKDLYGSQIDLCARVMSLAQGGQILLSRATFDSARQALKGEELGDLNELRWLDHGPYVLKGIEEPVDICEVGEVGVGVLKAPPGSEKAQQQVGVGEEPVLGWRPAVGQVVPNTKWVLEEKLGEGGFGEVWLGRHQTMKERRVFKFCFQADRVRYLKREMTLFRLLRERVGDHPNIVGLREVYFDAPPFYVEMDYVEGHDLRAWTLEQGGLAAVPLEMRLEIVAQIADALQAAHEAGVIHRDVKPANILIGSPNLGRNSPESAPESVRGAVHGPQSGLVEAPSSKLQDPGKHQAASSTAPGDHGRVGGESPGGAGAHSPARGYQPSTPNYQLSAKLTDFGIGQVVSEEYLAGVTRAGFTMTIMSDSSSSHTGTQMYMAPELLAGKPASTRSDIYSLGVVLYQLVVGDLTRPLTTDWAENITDPPLRDDLKLCFAGNPSDRFAGAGQLARHLRALPERQAALAKQRADQAAVEKAAYRRGIIRAAGAAGLVVMLLASLALSAFHQAGRARKAEAGERSQRLESERQVMRLTLANGLRLQKEGDLSGGLLWFARSIRLAQGNPAQEQINRLRFTSCLRCCPRLLQVLFHSRGVNTAWFSPDSRLVVTACWDGAARVWDVRSGEPAAPPMHHELGVMQAEFSPNGRWVVTASWDKSARVWDAATGQPLTPPLRHSGGVFQAHFSPDGRRIATASEDRTARVWDAATGEPVTAPLRCKTKALVYNAVFSPDSRWVLTGQENEAAEIWDASTGELVLTMPHETPVSEALFSPAGRSVATISGEFVRFWNPATGKETGPRLHIASYYGSSLQFSADGRRILAVAGESAQVWDTTTREPISPFLKHYNPNPDPYHLAALSPDGRWVATAGNESSVRVWDATTGEPVTPCLAHSSAAAPQVCFSPDSQMLLVASSDHTVRLWDLSELRPPAPPAPAPSVVNRVARSPDGRRLVIACGAGAAQVIDTATGKPTTPLLKHDIGADKLSSVLDCCFSPDGTRVATASDNGSARVWDAMSGQALTAILRHESGVDAVHFSPDGRSLVTLELGKEGRMHLWEVASGRAFWPAVKFPSAVEAAEFSPDGRLLVSCCADGKAQVWSAETGWRLTPPLVHDQGVLSGAFSPDSRLVVTTSYDRSARVWDALTGELVAGPLKHGQPVLDATFSPDGRRLQTTTCNGGWSWDLALDSRPPGALEKAAQTLAGRELDPAGNLAALSAENLTRFYTEVRTAYHQDWMRWRLTSLLPRPAPTSADATDQPQGQSGRPSHAQGPAREPFPVDLTPYYNLQLNYESSGGDLSTLPSGRQTFAGVDFDARGLIELWGLGLASRNSLTNLPHQVNGIRLARKCERFHFLQAQQYHDEPKLIGSYLVHYVGGQQWEIPIICGRDVWNWWIVTGRPTEVEVKQSVVAWTGRNNESRIALYKTTWENPLPGLEVESIDFRSNNLWHSPFLVALTLE